MQIIYQDDYMVAINKPSGFHVHPHEIAKHRVSRDKVCLYHVRDMLNQYVYPIHRLDAGTSGVLIFALSSESASRMCKLLVERSPEKTYHAIARGWVPSEGKIEVPLELDSTGELVQAETGYRRLATVELDYQVGKRFPKARYSWVEAFPKTGRFHQIRRHFNRISHPLVGDAVHGDSHHNRFFRTEMQVPGLCLHSYEYKFTHPWTQEEVTIRAPLSKKWINIQRIFNLDSPPEIQVENFDENDFEA